MTTTEPVEIGRLVELPERGVTLCVARSGSAQNTRTGRPLIVLNGTGSDLRNRPNPLDWPLGSRFDVMANDHRCLGRSVQHKVDYQPTMADFALDVIALADAEGIDQFDLMGVSFGGMVAQEVAIRAPQRVQSLVLCCTSSGGAGGSSYPLHEMHANGQTALDMLDRWDSRARTDEAIAEVLRARFAGRQGSTPPGLVRQIEARRSHDTWDRLGEIQADTFIACGEYDGVAPVENSRHLASAIPNAELASFEGGHMFLAQDRSAFDAIIDFLEN